MRYLLSVPLPQTIPVKYTEEEAEYLSVRPVVRQTFRLEELLDMLLSIAGKDVPRLQQILRSGTAVYHFYRYWWQGFEADAAELREALAGFPEDDPSRPFRRAECSAVLLETESGPGRAPLELTREEVSKRRWLRRASVWDLLMGLADAQPPKYSAYSYAHRGDLYRLELSASQAEMLGREGARVAPRSASYLRHLQRARQVIYLCPRNPAKRSA